MTRRAAIAVLSAAALAACVSTVPAGRSAPAGGGTVSPSAPPAAQASHVAALVNRHRASFGCPPLAWDERAARAAQAHSRDMARRDYFAHQSPEGTGAAERLRAQGVAWSRVAENLAQTSGGPDEAVRLWIRSAGHRRNIETCTLTHHGVAVAGDRWTHVFFTPLPTPAR